MNKLLRRMVERFGHLYFKIAYQPVGLDHAYDVSRFLESPRNVKVIFDVGANEGRSIGHYVHAFLCAQIYLFEPFTSVYSALVGRVSKFSGVRTFQLAFGDTNRSAKIQAAALSVQNTLRNELSKNCFSPDGELVTITMLVSFCAEQNISRIDLLKTDTKGSDLEVLKGANAILRSKEIRFILTEARLHPNDGYHTSFFHVTEYLSRFGYYFVELYDHAFASSSPTRPPPDYCNALCTACES